MDFWTICLLIWKESWSSGTFLVSAREVKDRAFGTRWTSETIEILDLNKYVSPRTPGLLQMSSNLSAEERQRRWENNRYIERRRKHISCHQSQKCERTSSCSEWSCNGNVSRWHLFWLKKRNHVLDSEGRATGDDWQGCGIEICQKHRHDNHIHLLAWHGRSGLSWNSHRVPDFYHSFKVIGGSQLVWRVVQIDWRVDWKPIFMISYRYFK